MRMKESSPAVRRFLKILPPYSWIPLLAILCVGVFTYFGTRVINLDRVHYTVAIALDDKIPLVPCFIYFYVLAYAQWFQGAVTVLSSPEEKCYEYVSGYMVVCLIAIVCFILYPTHIVRPEITGDDFTNRLLRLIYDSDIQADNLLPSLHCADCWMAMRITLADKRFPSWFKVVSVVFVLGVIASVVLIKQHFLVDIPAGILTAELGLLLGRVTPLPKLFGRINAKLRKKGWLPA